MRHYLSSKVRIILLLAVLIAVALGVAGNLTDFNLPSELVQGVLTPIRTAASKLTDQAEQLYGYIFRYEALAAENAALKEQLAQMEDDSRQSAAIERENQRLKEILEWKNTADGYVLLDAYIIARSPNDWNNTLTINRGTSSGLSLGMCAVTSNREMVGLITEIGSNYAVIKTLLDPSLEVSATIASSGYNGMVQGNYIDGQKDLLRMEYLPSGAVIRNRDEVVTTGSTVYPRNLIVGHVVDAGFDGSGVAKYALLDPAADIATLEQIFIITEYEVG